MLKYSAYFMITITAFFLRMSIKIPAGVVVDETPVSYTHLDVYKRQVINCFSKSFMYISARIGDNEDPIGKPFFCI